MQHYKDEAKRSQQEKIHRLMGGSTSHSDEAADRALVKKMVKKTSLTGKKSGGKVPLKRADGGKTSKSLVCDPEVWKRIAQEKRK